MRFIKPLKRFFFVLFFSFLILDNANSQSHILNERLTIEFGNLSLEEALQKLQAESKVNMSYDRKVLPDQKINHSFEMESLHFILTQLLLASELDYKLIGSTIVINKFKSEALSSNNKDINYTISGYVYDQSNYETLIGASIILDNKNVGTITNTYGFYSMSLPQGKYSIKIFYIGFSAQTIEVDLNQNITVDIELLVSPITINDVLITDTQIRKTEHINSTSVGSVDIDVETIKGMPALFGEIDVIKSIQFLPGIQGVGEGGSALYVRGGNADQNLILLDEAPVYNATHLGGFFSTFNPEAIKDLTVYRGGFPANYGGRLSSVIDIQMKDGNRKKFGLSGGIGSIMSRFSIESPIGKHGSFFITGRRTYLDALIKGLQSISESNNSENRNFDFFFFDFNTKVNYTLGNKDRLFASAYFGRDVFGVDSEIDNSSGVSWGNATTTFRWNHIYSPKLFSNLTFYYSSYNYFIEISDILNDINLNARLKEFSSKIDFSFFRSPNQTIKFGTQLIHHHISPSRIEILDNNIMTNNIESLANRSLESAVYLSNEINLTNLIKINVGLRLSGLHNLGPNYEYQVDENYDILDTIQFGSGIYNSNWSLEPRLKIRYSLSNNSSLKASYTRNTQYIQLASNGNFATPFDVWFTSSSQINPQLADQFSVGYFSSFLNGIIEISAEVFYKKFRNTIDFKDHAELLLNDNLETELRIGQGKSFGFELLLKKNTGRLSGWMGYTFSRSKRLIPDINNGQWYNTKYDKPHDFSFVISYKLSNRISLSTNFIYSTGGAVTFPVGGYDLFGTQVPIYSNRNDKRLPDYHRLDFSMTIMAKKNKNRRFQSEWVFSVFNLYNRKNTFAIGFAQEKENPNVTIAQKSAIFSIVPAVTYNFKF